MAVAFVAVWGMVDELAFHRGLPAVESDVHAKAHMALFAFAGGALLAAAFPSAAAIVRVVRPGSP
jgi:hypothetical protein